MFTHPMPLHVAVIGGGSGACIRELLKHNTVESITVIQKDALIIDIAREYLPSLSDCSDIDGVATNCFDDKRVNVVIEHAETWFLDSFGKNPTKNNSLGKFDVIIIESNQPSTDSDNFLNHEPFLDALMNSLSEDGVIALELGEGYEMNTFGNKAREDFILKIESIAGAAFIYEEGHNGFWMPTAYMTICKKAECRDRWYVEATATDYLISMRIKGSISKRPNLVHFDGSTHALYDIIPRVYEDVYCLRDPQPFECDYRNIDLTKDLFEFEIDEDDSNFEMKVDKDKTGKKVTTIVAKKKIPKGSYIMPSDLAASFVVRDYAHSRLKFNGKTGGDTRVIQNFLDVIDKHGHKSFAEGSFVKYVEIGGSTVIRKSYNADEVNVGHWMPSHPSGKQPVYSPVYERHQTSFDTFLVAIKDIQAGEELVKSDNVWSK